MKVTVIGGCLDMSGGFLGRYYANYHTKIEGRSVILQRYIEPDRRVRGPAIYDSLKDCICAYDCGNDEKLFEEEIQRLIENLGKIRSDNIDSDISKLQDDLDRVFSQMQKGREIDLSLANIKIYQDSEATDNEKASYQYLLNKKLEELSLDRLEQLKRAIQDNPNFYSLEIYLRKYEEQSGSKLSAMQIQGIRDFDRKMQDGVITGKYNLKEYITFLKSIPDLLSKKKFLAIGNFDRRGRFWRHGEIDEKLPFAEAIYDYTTYTYHRVPITSKPTKAIDGYKIISSPSIQYRMTPEPYRLCVIDVKENGVAIFSPEMQEIVKDQPNMKHVGNGALYSIYSDSSGILFAGASRPTIKDQMKLSAHDISIDLAEISRRGLTDGVQADLIELADKRDKEGEKSKEQL